MLVGDKMECTYNVTKSYTKKISDIEIGLLSSFTDLFNPLFSRYDVETHYANFLEQYPKSINSFLVYCCEDVRKSVEVGELKMNFSNLQDWLRNLRKYVLVYYITQQKFPEILEGKNPFNSISVRIPEECCYKITLQLTEQIVE